MIKNAKTFPHHRISSRRFEKMGKRKDAAANLQEMVRNPKLENFPETEQARRQLIEWGEKL